MVSHPSSISTYLMVAILLCTCKESYKGKGLTGSDSWPFTDEFSDHRFKLYKYIMRYSCIKNKSERFQNNYDYYCN